MRFRELQDRQPKYDEISVMHKKIVIDNVIVEILGWGLSAHTLTLFAMEYDKVAWERQREESENPTRKKVVKTNRQQVKEGYDTVHYKRPLVGVRSIEIDGQVLDATSATSTGMNAEDLGSILLVNEFIRQGVVLSDTMAEANVEGISLTCIEIEGAYKTIPVKEKAKKVCFNLQSECLEYPLTKKLKLEVGKAYPKAFKCGKGEEAFECYINRVHLMDLTKEMNKVFDHPNIKENFSMEEIAQMREKNKKDMAKICPEGTLLPVIEYEVKREGVSLVMYSQQYLNRPIKRSSSACGILLKPDKEEGIHGLPLRVVVLEEGVPADTIMLNIEITGYMLNRGRQVIDI